MSARPGRGYALRVTAHRHPPGFNSSLTDSRDAGSVSTRSSLISFFCFECAYRTSTTYEWLAEHGVTCEQCYRNIPVDAEELGRGLAAIDPAWGEVSAVAEELARPLAPVPNWAMPERVHRLVSVVAQSRRPVPVAA